MTKSTRRTFKRFHPKVIKTTVEHEGALARIEELFTAKPGTPEGDELELLLLLVEAYEAKEYPIDLPDPIQAIRFRMEQAKLKQKDLIPIFGSKGKVSEVLNCKRELSLAMIRKLVSELGIPAEVLLQEPSGLASLAARRERRPADSQQRHRARPSSLDDRSQELAVPGE
jgi:HTH-type transcriptional regulator / antitoxin HigA